MKQKIKNLIKLLTKNKKLNDKENDFHIPIISTIFKHEIKEFRTFKVQNKIDTKLNINFLKKLPFNLYDSDLFIFKQFKTIFDIFNINLPSKDELKYINRNKPLKIRLLDLPRLDFLQIFIYFYLKLVRFTNHRLIDNKAFEFVFIMYIYFILFILIFIINPLTVIAIILIRELLFYFFDDRDFNFYKKAYKLNFEIKHEFFNKSIFHKIKKPIFYSFNFLKLFIIFPMLYDKLKKFNSYNYFSENNKIYLNEINNHKKKKKSFLYIFFNFLHFIMNNINIKNIQLILFKIEKFLKNDLTYEYLLKKWTNILQSIDTTFNNIDKINFKIHAFLYYTAHSMDKDNIDTKKKFTMTNKEHRKFVFLLYGSIFLFYHVAKFGWEYGTSPTDIMLNLLGFYDYLLYLLERLIFKIQFYLFVKPLYLFFEYFIMGILNIWFIKIFTTPILIISNFLINVIFHFILYCFFFLKYFPKFFCEYFIIFYTTEDFKIDFFIAAIDNKILKLNFYKTIYKKFFNIIAYISYFNFNNNYIYFLNYIYKFLILTLIILPPIILVEFITFLLEINYFQILYNIINSLYNIIIKIYYIIKQTFNLLLRYIYYRYEFIFITLYFDQDDIIDGIAEIFAILCYIFYDHKNYFFTLKKNKHLLKDINYLRKSFFLFDIFFYFSSFLIKLFINFKLRDIYVKLFNFQYINLILNFSHKIILYTFFIFFNYLYFSFFIPFIQGCYLIYIFKNSYLFDKIIFTILLNFDIYSNFFFYLNIIIYIYFYLKKKSILNINYFKYYIYKIIFNLYFFLLIFTILPFGYIFFSFFLFTKYIVLNTTNKIISKYFRKYANFQNFFVLIHLFYYLFIYLFIVNFIFLIFFLLFLYIKIYIINIIFLILKYILLIFFLIINLCFLILLFDIIIEIKIYFNILFFDKILQIKLKKTKVQKVKFIFIHQKIFYIIISFIFILHLKLFLIQYLLDLNYNPFYICTINNEIEEILEELDEELDEEFIT